MRNARFTVRWGLRHALIRAAAGALLVASLATTAFADDRVTLNGCVIDRTPTTLTLKIDRTETVTVDTTLLKQEQIDDAVVDCVTVKAMRAEGRLVAESIEAGDGDEDQLSNQNRNKEDDSGKKNE
ncbi:MAG: hypothetical protein U0821_19430 [Chloroflexota bacterium]